MELRSLPLFALCIVSALCGCAPTLPNPAPPAVPKVSVSKPKMDSVADYKDYLANTVAVSTVDLRARVTGYLNKVHFQDGEIVRQDALLYEIDPRPFEEQLAQAKGQVERLKASEKYLQIEVFRYTELVRQQASTQQDLDKYLSQQAENVGALKAAEAQVRQAELNLGFTKIKAPIAGKISYTRITPGNLVNADSTLLTTITSIDPMYVYFSVEEPTMLRIQRLLREGAITAKDLHQVEVQMGLADDVLQAFPLRGTLDFVDNTVDPQTGTIRVRAVFANPRKSAAQPPLLTPGLSTRVRLHVDVPHQVALITERAIGTAQGEKYVYVVDQDNKVMKRRVKLGLVFGGLQAIEEGLTAADRVVVLGLQRIRQGMQVEPELVKMASEPASGGAEKETSAGKPAGPVTATASEQPKS